MNSSEILSASYIACHNHGCILAKHHQVPRNRSPLVECCSTRYEVPTSFLSSSASSSPLIVNQPSKTFWEENLKAKQKNAQMVIRNIKIPAEYYIREDPIKTPYFVLNKRNLSNILQKNTVF